MSSARRPERGDIIVSAKFAWGYRSGNFICVDGATRSRPIRERISEEKRLEITASTGSIPPKWQDIDEGAYDESRGAAKFVVESAALGGGGMSHNSPIPNGWRVTARRLDSDGAYDPDGELIRFFTDRDFGLGDFIPLEDIQTVGQMRPGFQ